MSDAALMDPTEALGNVANLSPAWFDLIDEKEAARAAGLSVRTLQNYRQVGGGPRYIKISARCIRYRRADLKAWADERLRASTSDAGQAA